MSLEASLASPVMGQQRRTDPTADRAEYRQLADFLRDDMARGVLPPGRLLPSERRLSQEYDLSVTSVRRALEVLRREGLIVTTRGLGSRVRARREITVVHPPPGAKVSARTASEDECRRLGLPEGSAVLVVRIGDEIQVYPGDDHEVEIPPEHP